MLRNTQRGIAVDTFYLFGVNFQSRPAIFTGRNEVVAKVIFLHLSVILSRGGLPQCMLGYHPLGPGTPQSRHPPGTRHPPWEQTPPEQTPPEQTPPGTRHTPREADSGIRSMSGRYASCWNAFLLCISLEIRS